jgi:hypothetical protein
VVSACEIGQQSVAGGVTEAVVDLLEAVEIEDGERERSAPRTERA